MSLKNKDEYNKYMAEYMLKRYHKRMEEARLLFGNKCTWCGSEDDLEFDHINSDDKSFTIAKMWSLSKNKFKIELTKCQLLCSECHKLKHNSKFPCGTPQRYWRGCRCIECTKANTSWNRNYKKIRAYSVNGKRPAF